MTQCLHSNKALIIQPLITLLFPLVEAGSPLLLTHPQAARAGAEWDHPCALGGVTSVSQTPGAAPELPQPPALHTTAGTHLCTPVLTLPVCVSVYGALPVPFGIFWGIVLLREATLKCGVGFFSPSIPSARSRVSSSHPEPGQTQPWWLSPSLLPGHHPLTQTLGLALDSPTLSADTPPASPDPKLGVAVPRPAAGVTG